MLTSKDILQLIAEISPLLIQLIISDGLGYDALFFSNSMIRDSESLASLQVFNFIVMLGLAVFIMGINSLISGLDILSSLIFVIAVVLLLSAFPLAKGVKFLHKRLNRIIIALLVMVLIIIHNLTTLIQ